MRRGLKYLYKWGLLFSDIIALNLFFVLILLYFQKGKGLMSFEPYMQIWIFINSIWIALCYLFGIYNYTAFIKIDLFIKKTTQVYVLWLMTLFLYLFITREVQFSRAFILLFLFLSGIVFTISRILFFIIRKFFKNQSHYINKIMILGYNDTAKKITKYFEEEELYTRLVGYAEENQNVHELTRYPIVCDTKSIVKYAKILGVNEIFSTIMPEQNPLVYKLMNDAEFGCVRFKIVPDFSLFLIKPVLVEYLKDTPILGVRQDPLEDATNRLHKRIFDLCISSFVVFFILSWLIPIIAICIKIESKGPIFFKQLRSGRNDIPFYCLKFRSMYLNSNADSHSATSKDNRITKFGSFLRKTSLDEFPQFINVLKGDMSIVGPRPHMVHQSVYFSKIVDHYMSRQFLKPGITGWAQINSYRGEVKDKQHIIGRITMDLWYYENWNIWLDIKIVFQTILQILKGDKQAY